MKKNHLQKVLAHINSRLSQAKHDISASIWYLAMPQLISRISHSNADTVSLIRDIVIKILEAHPEQVYNAIHLLIHYTKYYHFIVCFILMLF